MIRKGRTEELEQLLAVCAPYMAAQCVVPMDQRKIALGVLESLENGEVLVAEVDGELAGSAAFRVGKFWYSDQPVLLDKWIAVKPEYRRRPIAGRLLKALESEAKERGIPFMPQPMGDQSNAPTFAKRYKKIGTVFMKDAH